MNLKLMFLVLLITCLLISCTVTENSYVTTTGSGSFSVELDGSGLMSMLPKDSLKGQKNLDAIFTFKQILADHKDRIAMLSIQEQQSLKTLEMFNIRIQMNKELQQFLFTLSTDCKNVSELQDAMIAVNTMISLQNKGFKSVEFGSGLFQEGLGITTSNLMYAFQGNTFSRKATVMKKEIANLDSEVVELNKMIFASSNYILKYHFAKPIKKVSNVSVLFSQDRKQLLNNVLFQSTWVIQSV